MARKAKVLLVDDDTAVRLALKQALASEDFTVVTAGTGAEALRGFAENSIDVVLLDLDLGQENGWDTFERLKKIQPRLPVIVMSARPDEDHAPASQAVNARLEKPIDLPMLLRMLNAITVRTGENGLSWPHPSGNPLPN